MKLSLGNLGNTIFFFLLIDFHQVFRDLSVGFVLINLSSILTSLSASSTDTSFHWRELLYISFFRARAHYLTPSRDSYSLSISAPHADLLGLTALS